MDKCRPSYYLIEVDETPPSGTPQLKSFYVVHLMQIISDHINDIYHTLVTFKKDARTLLKGKVRAASSTKEYIEYKKKKLVLEQRMASSYNPNFFPYFLIKYSNEPHHMMFAVVPQHLISWITDGLSAGPIHLGDKIYQAIVLYADHNEAHLIQQLKLLKDQCNESAYAECFVANGANGEFQVDDPWLLVQFSFRPSHFAYIIVNCRDTVYQQENLFKDLVAYLPYGEDIIQAIVIRKSHDRSELKRELQGIINFSTNAAFPLKAKPDIRVEMAENIEPQKLEVTCTIVPTKECSADEQQMALHSGTYRRR